MIQRQEKKRTEISSWRGFYAILDLGFLGNRDAWEVGQKLLAASPVALQLRAKSAAPREILALAERLAETCREKGVPLIINDRADIASLCGAWGVHIGQEDLTISLVKRLFPELAVGVSTHSLAQLREALQAGADYVGFGPVSSTSTKERPDPVVGFPLLGEAIRAAGHVPVVAIGGISRRNLAEVVAVGGRVATSIGDVLSDPDPEEAARQMARLLQGEKT